MVPASKFPNIWFLLYNNNNQLTITVISSFSVLLWQLRVHLHSCSLFSPSFSTSPSAACSHADSGDWNISEKKLISQHAACQVFSNQCQVDTFQSAPDGFPISPLLQGCSPMQGRLCSRAHLGGSAPSLHLLIIHSRTLQRQAQLPSMAVVHTCSLLVPRGNIYIYMLQGCKKLVNGCIVLHCEELIQ